MSDTTPNLGLPYILPSQAQKHVMHNEALVMLDRLVQLAVEYEGAVVPSAPQDGQRYAVSGAATGAWSGRSGKIASFESGAWIFVTPRAGHVAWFKDSASLRVFDGSGWSAIAFPDELTVEKLGIGTAPDGTNRLALSSPATLLTHAGNGHQLKINKASSGDTASLLFQSAWSGRAEMGLAGTDSFSIKVSGTGANWATALTIDGNGRVKQPNRPLARAHRAAGTSTPDANTETVFSALALEQGGISLGATAGGGGQAAVVPADGLYLLSVMATATQSSGYSLTVRRNSSLSLLVLSGPATAPMSSSASGVFELHAGDALTFLHQGSATLQEGQGRTELSIIAFCGGAPTAPQALNCDILTNADMAEICT